MVRSALVCGLLAFSSIAHAGEPVTANADQVKPAKPAQRLSKIAEEHFQTGLALYRDGDYASARVEFQAAYDLSRLPDLLHNLSRVAQLEGKVAEAIALEERYLTESAEALSELEADQARGRIVRLRAQLASEGTTSPPTPRKSEQPSKSLPAVDAPTPSREATPRRLPLGAVGMIAIGGGLVIGGIGCGASALSTQSWLESGTPIPAKDVDAAIDRGAALERAGISLGVIGGAVLVGGTIWALVDRYGKRRASARLQSSGSALSVTW